MSSAITESLPDKQGHFGPYGGRLCRRRSTPLYLAERLTKEADGAKIYLKREDLLPTGAVTVQGAARLGIFAWRSR